MIFLNPPAKGLDFVMLRRMWECLYTPLMPCKYTLYLHYTDLQMGLTRNSKHDISSPSHCIHQISYQAQMIQLLASPSALLYGRHSHTTDIHAGRNIQCLIFIIHFYTFYDSNIILCFWRSQQLVCRVSHRASTVIRLFVVRIVVKATSQRCNFTNNLWLLRHANTTGSVLTKVTYPTIGSNPSLLIDCSYTIYINEKTDWLTWISR